MNHHWPWVSLAKNACRAAGLLLLCLIVHGCANIIPPGGGPRDSTAPLLLTASPENGSAPLPGRRIILTFDEYVTLDKLFENLLVNPRMNKAPNISSKLRNVTIRLQDSLLPNTTYTIDFGNAIKDVNEGNPLGNFLYAFSTGPVLDSHTIAGKALLAEDGTADTTLVAVLHSNLQDTAVQKLSPDYVARINREGAFQFSFLPAKNYRLFVLPNDYNKRYDDSTKRFAFYPGTLRAGTNPEALNLLVFQESKKAETRSTTTTQPSTRNVKPKPLAYATSAKNGSVDLLEPFTISFSRPLRQADSSKLVITDTNYRVLPQYSFRRDTGNTRLLMNGRFRPGVQYRLLVDTLVATDTLGQRLSRIDTVKLQGREESEYGSLVIRFVRQDSSFTKPLLQLYQGENLVFQTDASLPLYRQTLFAPGDYEIRILDDLNGNGRYDTGNYKQKRQPEKAITLKRKLQVKANYDNEAEVRY